MMRLRPSRCLRGLVLLTATAFASHDVRAAEHVVRIVSDYENLRMAFVPDVLHIEPGDDVTWVNEADEEHDVVTFPDGYPRDARPIHSPLMVRTGEKFSHRLDVPGTYEYHCMPHLPMGMQGVIIVGRPSTEGEFHEPSPSEINAYKARMLEWFDDVDVMDRKERASAAISGVTPAFAGHENQRH